MHAPSVYFNYRSDTKSNVIAQQICVPYSTPGTFYAVLNWNSGDKYFSGYAGFQMLSNGAKTVHFSLWHPEPHHKEFKLLKNGAGGTFHVFDNELTGRKFVAPFNFTENEWYRFVLTLTHTDDDQTEIELKIIEMSTRNEHAIATINYPEDKHFFKHSYGSFLEDFSDTIGNPRKYMIKDGGLVDLSKGKWVAWDEQEFSFNSEGERNLNGGVENDSFFLESGGETKLTAANRSLLKIK